MTDTMTVSEYVRTARDLVRAITNGQTDAITNAQINALDDNLVAIEAVTLGGRVIQWGAYIVNRDFFSSAERNARALNFLDETYNACELNTDPSGAVARFLSGRGTKADPNRAHVRIGARGLDWHIVIWCEVRHA